MTWHDLKMGQVPEASAFSNFSSLYQIPSKGSQKSVRKIAPPWSTMSYSRNAKRKDRYLIQNFSALMLMKRLCLCLVSRLPMWWAGGRLAEAYIARGCRPKTLWFTADMLTVSLPCRMSPAWLAIWHRRFRGSVRRYRHGVCHAHRPCAK